ncbi:hypothetical protein L596_010958 [Steinernema carpocapsae]|uniref:Uncharacterized protein n=1 Tax=Steinernema carpocapsae TaxID=34508 RepID=A0A4U5NT56_STECR|nr:hypothetical protein L596_010958 [Steinernema carpocapsae]
MNLDRHNIPDIAALQKAGKNAEEISKQKQGWAEAWNYIPQPLSNVQPNNLFNPPVPECADARWIQLNYAVTNQKSAKCTNCFDFCLPEYGIEKEFGRN